MFISRIILFAFKNWKIASHYGFASGVSRPFFDAGLTRAKGMTNFICLQKNIFQKRQVQTVKLCY